MRQSPSPAASGRRLGPVLLLALLVPACAPRAGLYTQGPDPDPASRTFTVVSINDVYRIEGVEAGEEGGLARVRALREELEREAPDLLLLHAGDFLYPSLLSRAFDGAQMIDVLNLLDGDPEAFDQRFFATFGNHEFDEGRREQATILEARVAGSAFRWLSANVRFATLGDGRPLVAAANLLPSVVVESGGVRVGIFGLTLDENRPDYVAEIAGAREAARKATAVLRRQGAEVVIGLTHLRLEEDVAVLEALGPAGPDVAFGGHEHGALERRVVGADGRTRAVIKADADARSAVVARITLAGDGRIDAAWEIRRLKAENPMPDSAVAARVEGWIVEHDALYCDKLDLPAGCLGDELALARSRLAAEELEIRRFETNLGSWVADRMLEEMAAEGAQLAFINSGGLRLNQDVPEGAWITRQTVEELFAFPAGLRLLEISGETLQEAASWAVQDWTGNGRFLQVAGFAFRHDPETATVSSLTLLGEGEARPIRPDETLRAVTVNFLVDPAGRQDGYTMLGPEQIVAEGRDLKRVVHGALVEAGAQGIAPLLEGRICNPRRPGPCLAAEVPAPGL